MEEAGNYRFQRIWTPPEAEIFAMLDSFLDHFPFSNPILRVPKCPKFSASGGVQKYVRFFLPLRFLRSPKIRGSETKGGGLETWDYPDILGTPAGLWEMLTFCQRHHFWTDLTHNDFSHRKYSVSRTGILSKNGLEVCL